MATQGRRQLGSGPQEQTAEMQIMSQPRGALRPAVTLYPPLTVRLGFREAVDSGPDTIGNASHLWAFVSLTDEEGVETAVPPRQDLLSGRLTDSAHPLSAREHIGVDGDGLAVIQEAADSFVMFPDLAIREVGRYRLRVTLFGMQTDTEEAAAGPQGASSLQEVLTDIIEIRDQPRIAGTAVQESEFLSLLRRQGVAVPLPPIQ